MGVGVGSLWLCESHLVCHGGEIVCDCWCKYEIMTVNKGVEVSAIVWLCLVCLKSGCVVVFV